MAARGKRTGADDAWDQLVGELYDCVLEPGRLFSTLRLCDVWLGAQFCHLMGWDRRFGAPAVSVMTDPAFHEAGRNYANYYGRIDPRRDRASTLSMGEVRACHDWFDKRFVSSDEFYQDFLIPAGPRYIIGGPVFQDENLSIFIAFNHLLGQPEFDDDQRVGVQRLMPHLHRTMKLMFSIERIRGGLMAGEHGLNALDQAVFTVDILGRIVFANEKANDLIRDANIFKAVAGKLTSKVEAARLSSALDRAKTNRKPESLSFSADMSGTMSYLVTILPVPKTPPRSLVVSAGLVPASHGESGSTTGQGSMSEGDLVVLIAPQRRVIAASANALTGMFGLSDAEARLAHALAAGASVEEYSTNVGVTIATTRTHLRSILAKTGERRQQDLVRMLGALPSRV